MGISATSIGKPSLALGAWFAAGAALAQDAANQAAASAPDLPAPVVPAVTETATVAISAIRSDFGTLLMLTYLSVALGVLIGLIVYVRVRRAYKMYAVLKGAACAALCALVLYGIAASTALSPEASACSSAILEAGNRAGDYDDQCRAARERAGDAFLAVSVFRKLFLAPDIPASAGAVKGLLWVSVPIWALIFFFVFRPLAFRLGVKA